MNGDIVAEPEFSEPEPGVRLEGIDGSAGTWTVVPSVGKNIDVAPDVAATPFGLTSTLPAAESTLLVESIGRAAPDGPVGRFAAADALDADAFPPSPAVPAVVRLHPVAMPATST